MVEKTQPKKPRISVIVPVYNESAGIALFHSELSSLLDAQSWGYELIYIDDGSTDDSSKIIEQLERKNHKVRLISFSKNFGKEAATTAGLHAVRGQAAIIIDSDGQHPVELIPEFITKWEQGSKVVVGVRTANQREGVVKHLGSKMFYRLLRTLGVPDVMPGSTDFRLVDEQVIRVFKKLTEHNRVTRALIDWLGFDRDYIEFVAKPREHGTATYSIRKLVRLALNGFVSLSFTPLYLSGYIGLAITSLSFVASIFAIIEKYFLSDPLNLNITGTAILATMLLFLVGILLIGQGLLAIYIARIYSDTQGRPLYIIKD